jgi:hypothetical protein
MMPQRRRFLFERTYPYFLPYEKLFARLWVNFSENLSGKALFAMTACPVPSDFSGSVDVRLRPCRSQFLKHALTEEIYGLV